MIKIIITALILLLPINPSHPKGTLVIAGGNVSSSIIHSEFIKLSGENSKIAIVTTASPSNRNDNINYWSRIHKGEIVSICNDDLFPKDIRGVWICGGDQSFLEKKYIGKPFEKKLMDFYNKGGIIGGTSAGSAFMSKIMIRCSVDNDPETPEMGTGLDLLPQAIIDQHFTARNRLPRLKKAVSGHPGIHGFGIDENTAMVYNGGRVRIIGENTVTVLYCDTVNKVKSGEEFSYGINGINVTNGGTPEDLHSRKQASLSTKP